MVIWWLYTIHVFSNVNSLFIFCKSGFFSCWILHVLFTRMPEKSVNSTCLMFIFYPHKFGALHIKENQEKGGKYQSKWMRKRSNLRHPPCLSNPSSHTMLRPQAKKRKSSHHDLLSLRLLLLLYPPSPTEPTGPAVNAQSHPLPQ